MNRIEIEVDGRKESVFAEADKNGLWVHYKSETYFIEKSKATRVRKRDESAGGDIVAPMPGKVTKVLVVPGQEVAPKQTLVVMEAMKMEYNLRSHIAAKVKSVFCKEGEQVGQDQLLVEFEKL